MRITVSLLRELLRHLAHWRSLYESDGVDTIRGPDGEYAIQDIEFLYALSQSVLPIRQRQAIRLCLLNNLTEEEAAAVMKIDLSNPVAMYATSGLETIIHMCRVGILPSRQKFWAQKNARAYQPNWATVIADVQAVDPRIGGFFFGFELEDHLIESEI